MNKTASYCHKFNSNKKIDALDGNFVQTQSKSVFDNRVIKPNVWLLEKGELDTRSSVILMSLSDYDLCLLPVKGAVSPSVIYLNVITYSTGSP